MLFSFPITVPANTSADNPTTQTLKLDVGVITTVGVRFAAGCHGLVQVRLLKDESILVPLNKDTWLNGDDETVENDVYYQFESAPYELKFLGSSPGTSYAHTVLVRVNVLSVDVALPSEALTSLVAILKQYLRIPQTVML